MLLPIPRPAPVTRAIFLSVVSVIQKVCGSSRSTNRLSLPHYSDAGQARMLLLSSNIDSGAGSRTQVLVMSKPEEQRIQKIIAHAGICSRREAERQIEDGNVRVNGKSARTRRQGAPRRSDLREQQANPPQTRALHHSGDEQAERATSAPTQTLSPKGRSSNSCNRTCSACVSLLRRPTR